MKELIKNKIDKWDEREGGGYFTLGEKGICALKDVIDILEYVDF